MAQELGPENEDFDEAFGITMQDAGVLKNLADMGQRLKQLKLDVLAKEAAFKEAEKEYNYYASSVLPMAMFSAGINSLELVDGGRMTYERKYYCTPNKNEADKQKMAEWLRKYGGDHLIKEKATVDGKQIEALKAAGIPYTEIADMNTNSLKAFLKDKLGLSGGTQQIELSDIPECMHFQEVGMVNIEV